MVGGISPCPRPLNELIASMVRKVGGFTSQELNLAIDDIKRTPDQVCTALMPMAWNARHRAAHPPGSQEGVTGLGDHRARVRGEPDRGLPDRPAGMGLANGFCHTFPVPRIGRRSSWRRQAWDSCRSQLTCSARPLPLCSPALVSCRVPSHSVDGVTIRRCKPSGSDGRPPSKAVSERPARSRRRRCRLSFAPPSYVNARPPRDTPPRSHGPSSGERSGSRRLAGTCRGRSRWHVRWRRVAARARHT